MDVTTANRVLVVLVLISTGVEKLLTKELRALQINTHRFDNESDALQLHLYWGTPTDKVGDTVYVVTVEHIRSAKCTMENTEYENQQNVRCELIMMQTEDTSVQLPRYPEDQDKYECLILPYCLYEVTVKPLNRNWRMSRTYLVPECIQRVCSCYYDKYLPKVIASTKISENKMITNWNLQENVDSSQIPSDVKLEKIVITVRRGNNGDLLDGEESNKKTVYLPAHDNGSYKFDLSDFAGDNAIFVTQVRLYDSRRCYSEAAPQTVQNPVPFPMILCGALILACVVVGGIIYKVIFKGSNRHPHRVETNWHRGHDTSSSDQHAVSMVMEENNLHINLEGINAQTREEADFQSVSLESLRTDREIGKGIFGRSFDATNLPDCNGPTTITVKQLKKSSKQAPELEEFHMMKKIGQHPNIVTLIGFSNVNNQLIMIMEYVGCVDLLQYLHKVRRKYLVRRTQQIAAVTQSMTDSFSKQRFTSNPSTSTIFNPKPKYIDMLHYSSLTSDASYIHLDAILRPSITETEFIILRNQEKSEQRMLPIEYVLDHRELHDFARQIASGMQYLEENDVTHRNLTARNILIDERKRLKISEFGLSRDGIYIATGEHKKFNDKYFIREVEHQS